MKKYLAILMLPLAVAGCALPNVNRIKQDDVKRIIATLSADDMEGRATFSPGIEKAAKFIENEFTDIGLKPLPGNTSYRQNFTMLRTRPVKTAVTVNGKAIAADSVIVSTTAPAIDWANNADVQVVSLTAAMDFNKQYAAYTSGGKKMLVVVDPKFTASFKRIAARASRGSTTFMGGTGSTQSVVMVLGSFEKVNSFAVKYEGKSEQLQLCNIAGMIPGKSEKEEYVVFSGHYDHLGIIKPTKLTGKLADMVVKPMAGDSIANGADDDASGVTAMISLAKYYKHGPKPQRTLIFVAFTAEEIGGYGSTYFGQHVDPDKTVAMFNIEMIGKPSKFGQNSAFITGYERSDFGEILQRNLAGTQFKFYPDPYPQQNLFYRSDNATLARLGVPAHTISTDQIDIDKLYHTVGDELSSLDVNNITLTIRAIALSSRTIISGKDTPKRIPKQE
ncbi:M20/M25/M40 family metallo-hydrolase [Mucilaginibacter sp. HMF5004]|uniref:M20/M25/M40 family metallo-hydrolase n=1 Tax=Mucilaginibacter rivuli TaxID=2857527 RepID=UPI001C5CEBFA|nr:M20/M25/M40 family metallo-hydrolase [Mucilaginibacter rivuli]MBW4888611.1 M20/M25/M40 family metallo-hydrolase [Mucilaginibacter rivuli]